MNKQTRKVMLWLLDLGINIVIIFLLVIVIQKWVIAPFDVSGASMCNTLNFINEECEEGYGEKIVINEAGYFFGEPERGDIVVFSVPEQKTEDDEDKYFIKRVVGLPGETIELKDGEVFITKKNGEKSIKIDEYYLKKKNKGKTVDHYGMKVFQVPENYYFVLGDNRNNSTDSRSCFNNSNCTLEKAFISKESIRGRAWFVWWPLKSIRGLNKLDYPELEESLEEK